MRDVHQLFSKMAQLYVLVQTCTAVSNSLTEISALLSKGTTAVMPS